jgi:hypothetical protein
MGTHDVYLTVYNRTSFPVLWCPVTQPQHTTAAVPVDGTYLLRVHARTPDTGADGAGAAGVRVHTVPAQPDGPRIPCGHNRQNCLRRIFTETGEVPP